MERDQTNRTLSDLRLSVAPAVLEKILAHETTSFDSENFDFDALSSSIVKHKDLSGVEELVNSTGDEELPREDYSQEAITERLRELSNNPDALKDFALRFAEKVFVAGKVKPSGLHEKTSELLASLASDFEILRNSNGKDPIEDFRHLRTLDRKLVRYVLDCTTPDSPDERESRARMVSGANYWALNEQHKQIALFIKEREAAITSKLPKNVQEKLETMSVFDSNDLEKFGKTAKQKIEELVSLGIVHRTEIDGNGAVYAFAYGNSDVERIEQAIPKKIREAIGSRLREEFRKKYSGQIRPIGISETRFAGVPSLLDRARIKRIADDTGVGVGHVVQMLKYFEGEGLITNTEGAYSLTKVGENVGLGYRAIRLMRRLNKEGKPTAISQLFEKYLEDVTKTREGWKTPIYKVQSKDGGLPKVTVFDRAYFGNARIDERLIKAGIDQANDQGDGLVIAGNMLQGPEPIERRKLRTTAGREGSSYGSYLAQLTLLEGFFRAITKPILHILGPMMQAAAERRAYAQALRENVAKESRDGKLVRLSEIDAYKNINRKNNQKQYTEQQGLAEPIATWGEFISRIVIPFEVKLGRELWDTDVIHSISEIDMNELEIVKDIAVLMSKHNGLRDAENEIREEYQDFLDAVETTDSEYLAKLERIIFSDREELGTNELVSRAGATLQFVTPEGKKGLSFKILPDFKFGKGAPNFPTVKMISQIKSMALNGQGDLPDVVMVMNSGKIWASSTETGTLVISPGTMQTSNYDDDSWYTEPQDDHKRTRTVAGGDVNPAVMTVSGGVTEGKKTNAYTFQFATQKNLDILENNKRLGREHKEVKVYYTSDWQTGSPTMQPEKWLLGLLWAIENGAEDIVINGDVIQGQNYGRYVAESQLVEHPLVGVGDQITYVTELMSPVLALIRDKKRNDPNWNPPKFRITAGNHETNTQSGKGGQGIWFLEPLEVKLREFYEGLLDDEEKAKDLVEYSRAFIAHDGTPIDYSHTLVDYTDVTGNAILVQHYVGAGAKGSSLVPPIASFKAWARAMGGFVRQADICLMGHFHTLSWAVDDGTVFGIFGANASGSGFEHHLGYPPTDLSNGMITLSTDKVPEFFHATGTFLDQQEAELLARLHSIGRLKNYKSISEFCLEKRKEVSSRTRGVTDYSKIHHPNAPHQAIDPNREIGLD